MVLLPKTGQTFGIWTQYVNYRFKEPHDILLKDGSIMLSMYPNGEGWGPRGGDGQTKVLFKAYCDYHKNDYVKDSDVVAVRLLTDKDIEERKLEWFTGKDRTDRIHQYHAEGREHVVLPRNALIKDDVVRDFINEMRDVCVRYGASQQLRAHVGKLTKKTFSHLFYNQ